MDLKALVIIMSPISTIFGLQILYKDRIFFCNNNQTPKFRVEIFAN